MLKFILLPLLSALLTVNGYAQINNLVHPEGYQSAEYGSLGKVEKFGKGPKHMIMISGWGFDGRVFENLKVDSIKENYTLHIVTLPGFGGTPAYPMPDQNEVYQDLFWTMGIIQGIKALIEKEGMEKPLLLSYFTYSNILALRLAMDDPDLLDRVIIISGMAKFTAMNPSYEPSSLAERIYYTEQVIAQTWWKNIDRKGWDNGNFSPATFSKDSIKADKYWKQMSDVPIPIMVRYLLEYYCTDLSLEYQKLQVPTLVVMPSFTREILVRPENTFLTHIFHQSWWGANPSNDNFHLMTITDSHAFVFDDQPEKLMDVIDKFAQQKLSPYDLQR